MRKVLLLLAIVLTAFWASAKTMSLADARRQIGACIKAPQVMTATMKKLSAEDQKTFLAEVNKAIGELPVSNEAKTAAYLNVDKAALRGAAKGNLSTLVAEVFATVPPESLCVLNERLAADMFNRAADSTRTYTDAQYLKIAEALMSKVNDRMKDVEDGAARSAFAILMLAQASNGTPSDLTDKLIETLPEAARNEARVSWIPAALGDKQEKSYEPILGATESTSILPANEVVIRIAGPQQLDALLGDIVEDTPVVYAAHSLEKVSGAISTKDLSATTIPPANRQEIEPQGYQNQY